MIDEILKKKDEIKKIIILKIISKKPNMNQKNIN